MLKSDHAQRTCEVKWLGKAENKSGESVSVYDIGPHPNFNFKMGDIVGRLIDINSSEMQEPANNHTGRFCGQVNIAVSCYCEQMSLQLFHSQFYFFQ